MHVHMDVYYTFTKFYDELSNHVELHRNDKIVISER